MSLVRKAAGAAFWVAFATYAGQLITFLANIALMRLIAPEAFGVLSLATFFCTLARKLVGFGFNHALIHKQDDLDTAAGTHFALNLASAAVVMLTAFAAYPAVAHYYDRLTALVLIGVSVGAAFESASFTPRIMLEKQVEFRGLMLLNLAINLTVNGLAVGAAWLWPNVWVLAFRVAGAQAIEAIGYWKLNAGLKLQRPTRDMARWFLRFGSPLWLAGLATFAVLQFDDFLVGTMIDEKALGFYSRAYALAVLPTTMVGHIVARVAFPIYSQLQRDKNKLSEAFTLVMRLIVLFSGPAALGLAYCAPEFVAVVFGETWRPMASLVRYLLLYEVLRPMFDDVGELFTAIGEPRKISRIQVAQAIAVVVLTPPLVYFFAAKGAALSVGLVMLLGVILAYRDLRPHVIFDFWGVLVLPLVLCLGAAGLSALVLSLWQPAGEVTRLIAKIVLFGGFTVLLLGLAQGRRLRREYGEIKNRLTKREAV
ncbi:MAG: oligosaccharide flippase family protein [Myxococcales bacterium]|nr:oligosaccharide flippase family protein [Myxococcales bacterium]